MDPFDALALGVATVAGGGTIRDMALDHGPVFWAKNPTGSAAAMVTSMLAIVLVRQPRRLSKWTLLILDAVDLTVFVGTGVNRVFNAEAGPLVVVCVGVITGVDGGIIRGVLIHEIPIVLRTKVYAVACTIGGTVHAMAYYTFSVSLETVSMMGMAVTLLIRLAATRWHFKPPASALDESGRWREKMRRTIYLVHEQQIVC